MKSFTFRRGVSAAAVVIALGLSLLGFARVHSSPHPDPVDPVVPAHLALIDFQTAEDARLMAKLRTAADNAFVRDLEKRLIKPVSDDVRTRRLETECIEVTGRQFPELHSVVLECARILHLERVPRVFVSSHAKSVAATENYTDPAIVLQAGILERFTDPAELRFIIGREMGHIKAGHSGWDMLLHRIKALANKLNLVGHPYACLPLLPLLRWSRQAEMTAENAGLICAQDEHVAERVLLRLATGVDASPGKRLNVDAFLHQTEAEKLSSFSEAAQLWHEWNRPTPFVASRILQLRAYSKSARFRKLWGG